MESDEVKNPVHAAIILDGNGRWAEHHGVERKEGHKAGAENVEVIMDDIRSTGLKYVTLYAFSTENWKRSKEEVSALMSLLTYFLKTKCDTLVKNKVRLLATGRIDGLPEEQQEALKKVIEKTSHDYEFTLILALNYGGRAEIADAAKQIAREAVAGKLDPETINEKLFADYLYHPEIPDPDILIRTSGEFRLSNFLLWECSYSEIFITDTLWPDFHINELREIIAKYKKRDRRFGGRNK